MIVRKHKGVKVMKNAIQNGIKIIAAVVTVVIMILTISVNISPDFAMAMSDVPVLGGFVRVVTFERYENKIGGSEADFVIPKIEGLKNEELMEEINSSLGNEAKLLIAEFEKEATALKNEYGDEAHIGMGSNYQVRTDNEDYFALDVYFYHAAGSSITVHKYYTIDKKEGKLLKLEDMFKTDSNYVEIISEIVKKEMIRLNEEEEGMFWVEADEYGDGFAGIKKNNSFFINEDGNVVICFDKYEVAPGVQGSPEFVIAKELVKDILK